jgi:hypothetical protein
MPHENTEICTNLDQEAKTKEARRAGFPASLRRRAPTELKPSRHGDEAPSLTDRVPLPLSSITLTNILSRAYGGRGQGAGPERAGE